ncbi:MAG: hypothetical protein JNK78_17185 [Planctomycetes bacterium]|nr:hypothetical protein [Planctomycetota bacterium]
MPRCPNLVAPLVAALSVVACATPIRLPKDFLELHSSGAFRAVTGDDARVWVREFEDPNSASLAFWATALEHEFTQQRGYDIVGKGAVKNRDGDEGAWFECAANVAGRRVGYLCALWVDGRDVQVVEFAADAEVFAARVEGVRAALKTVR